MLADLDIVVPFHGRLDLVLRCVEALAANEPISGQIILVDDRSPQDEVADCARALQRLPLPIRWLRQQARTGFVAAVNAGCATCTKSTVLVLNNDAIVPRDLIRRVRNAFAANARLDTSPRWGNSWSVCTNR